MIDLNQYSDSYMYELFGQRTMMNNQLVSLAIQYTQGGMYFNVWGADTKNLKHVEGIVIHLPIGGNTKKQAQLSLRNMVESRPDLGFLEVHDKRIYLKKAALPKDFTNTLKKLKWVQDLHRSAYFDFIQKDEVPNKEGPFATSDRHTKKSWSLSVLFHRYYKTIQQKLALSTLQVISPNAKGDKCFRGSAFAVRIGNDLIFLTAKHVAPSVGQRLTLRDCENRTYASKVIAVLDGIDITVLEPPSKFQSQYLLLGNSERCELEDKVYASGYPAKLGQTPTVSVGHISRINADYKNETGLVQISSAAINPNNSGGPVTDYEGKVIGILTMRALKSDLQNVAFAEPIGRALEALAKG